MRKKNMKGVISRMFTLVSERMRVHEAIQELIDNGIDAHAKNIKISLDSSNNQFLYVDDGVGMNGEQINVYAENYISHMPTSETSIGEFGAGSKDAIIKIADNEEGSNVSIVSWVGKNEVSRMRFNVDSKKEDDFRNPDILTTPDEKWINEHGEHGHQIFIKYIKDIDSKDRQWKTNLKKECSKAYSYIVNKYGVNIEINGDKLECVDRMHLDALGKDIEQCGVYFKNNMVFVVKSYPLISKTNVQDRKNIKVVYLYVTKEAANSNDENKYEFGGLYPILGDRYLKVPSNNEYGVPFALGHRGGTGRCRACIFVDGNEDVLSLKSKKSDGIDISTNNLKLLKYRVVNTDDTFTKAFEKDFKALDKLSHFQGDDNKNRILTIEIAKKIINGDSLIKLKDEYDGTIKIKTQPIIAPICIDGNEEASLKTKVDEELEQICESSENALTNNNLVIELHVNKTTGKTEYNYTEYKPKFCNEEYVDKLFNILVEEGVAKCKIAKICSKMAYSFA